MGDEGSLSSGFGTFLVFILKRSIKPTQSYFDIICSTLYNKLNKHVLSKWLWPCVAGWQIWCGRGCTAIAIMAVYSNVALNTSSDKGTLDSICEASLDSLSENEWHLSYQQETWPCSLHGDVITMFAYSLLTFLLLNQTTNRNPVWVAVARGQCQKQQNFGMKSNPPPLQPHTRTHTDTCPLPFKLFSPHQTSSPSLWLSPILPPPPHS